MSALPHVFIIQGVTMIKTKLGISVGLFGAALYFSGLFGGFLVLLLLAGYVMLAEENEWIRKTAVKAVTLLIAFSLLPALVRLIPDLIGWINNILRVFSDKATISTLLLSKIMDVIYSTIDIGRTVLFICLGIKAFNQGTIAIPVVDGVADKYAD